MFLWSFFLNQFCILALIFLAALVIFGRKNPKAKVIFFNLFAIFTIIGLFDVLCTTFFAPPYANFRTNSTYYHHGLKPNMTEKTKWFQEYTIHTNSLSFVDESPRVVPLKKQGKRFVFIGDSFTEGVSQPWAKTFPGIAAAALKKEGIELLNAGCVSYSPKIYYLKMKYFIEKGLEMDDLYVFIDISDIQDEIEYAYFKPTDPVPVVSDVNLFFYQNSFTYRSFYDFFFYMQENPRSRFSPYWENNYYGVRHLWMSNGREYSKWGKEGLELATGYMTKLYELTEAHGINLHIAVYPWRMQIAEQNKNPLQVAWWKKFCEDKNIEFIDFFPYFIDGSDPVEAEKRWFIENDIHWNEEGLRKMGESVIDHFQKQGIIKSADKQ